MRKLTVNLLTSMGTMISNGTRSAMALFISLCTNKPKMTVETSLIAHSDPSYATLSLKLPKDWPMTPMRSLARSILLSYALSAKIQLPCQWLLMEIRLRKLLLWIILVKESLLPMERLFACLRQERLHHQKKEITWAWAKCTSARTQHPFYSSLWQKKH